MATPEEVTTAISDNAVGPKRVRVGNQEVESHSVEDQIKAAQFAASQEATAASAFGLRFAKFRPRYNTGDCE